MPEIRYKKVFPKDINSSTVQRDLSQYTRVARVDHVDSQKGTCTLLWLDRPGKRYDVLLTQGSPNEWNMPNVGDCVLVGFDHHERARILRYINIGHTSRVKNDKSLPKLKPGEKLWEVGGSYLYLKDNGDILLSTLNQGYIILESNTGTWKSETVNYKHITEGGISYFGLVKRFKKDGTNREFQEIRNEQDETFTEYRIRVLETADGTVGITGIEEPFIDIVLGTYANTDGDIVNKNNVIATNEKQLAVRIELKSGVKIFIDKDGRVSLEAKSWNLNKGSVDSDDSDIALGLETNDSSKGSKGQHIAREHDTVTIPFSNNYTDTEHVGLVSKAAQNLGALSQLASAIISPAGPCTLNAALLLGNIKLEGEITEGADNLYAGDE